MADLQRRFERQEAVELLADMGDGTHAQVVKVGAAALPARAADLDSQEQLLLELRAIRIGLQLLLLDKYASDIDLLGMAWRE